MNKDFRVSVGLVTHPKTIKLMKRCGDRAFYSLIRLWSFAAVNRPSGELSGMDVEDIEIAADWNASACEHCKRHASSNAKTCSEHCSNFVDALLDVGFLENGENSLQIHDWKDHNEFASFAEKRSEKAKKAARARWEKAENTGSMLNDARSIAASMPEQCPSPSPSPSLKDTPPPPAGGDREKRPRSKTKKEVHEDAVSSCEIPSCLDTDDFNSAWADFCDDRADRKSWMTERAVLAQLKKLSAYSSDVAALALRESVANGWTGVFPEKFVKKQPQRPTEDDENRITTRCFHPSMIEE